ncbi:MAG TPA: xanthine dehydrogenase family protein molybdopterin-binding subunit [Chloroflexota bacterium]|nr:xanthine dehydrogenase family protein molybdopterin-binding subunit [Chloroflexota bacterium]
MATTADRLNQPNVVLSTTDYRVVGTRPVRHDGVDKVTGRAVYGADVRLPGMLYARVLRSPHAHARIVKIDTSKAEALPGVRAVVTGADLPEAEDKILDLGEGAVNPKFLADNVLADEKALYQGHAVAGVAATSQQIAEEAIKLIEVQYEPLPAVLDVRAAMKESAPLLHQSVRTKEMGRELERPSNVAEHFRHELGDLDKGWQEAEVVVEREVTTATVHQGYIEPHASTAVWGQDGNLTVWTSTQGAFPVRDQLAQVLKVPVGKVKVIPTEIGGGFGGKIPLYLEPVVALLSKKTGRPVKSWMTRADVLAGTGPTPGSYVRCKVGAKRDGRIVAAEAEIVFEAGAYPGSAVGAAASCMFAPYDIPNGRIDGYDVVVNKPRSFAYRAPGAPQAAFASEVAIDMLAEKLGMDPLELRLKNASKEGTRRIDGPTFGVIGNEEVLRVSMEHPHYRARLGEPPPGWKRGRGVANGYWGNWGGPSTVTISVNPDGTATMLEGSTDIGGSRAAMAMQAAEILGLRAEDVRPTVADTDSIGFTHVTGGSRTTFATGLASVRAAEDVLRQMKERAALLWESDAGKVSYDAAAATFSADGKSMSFREVAEKLGSTGGPVTGRANVDAGGWLGAFAVNIVDLDVDPETGKVKVLRYTVVQDAGKAIHPSYVEGQMQGGSVQGIGWALNEEYFYSEDGRIMNGSLLDYRMPTALDVPMIDTVIVEVANPNHPFGVRGVGEVPIVAPLAAICNAIHAAIGKWPTRLPMNPAVLLEEVGAI